MRNLGVRLIFYGIDGVGVFRITPGGVFTLIYSTTLQNESTNGYNPAVGLVQASSGNLYGVNQNGGIYGMGTVFDVSLGGTFNKIYDLKNPDAAGGGPITTLIQASDGDLWGTGLLCLRSRLAAPRLWSRSADSRPASSD